MTIVVTTTDKRYTLWNVVRFEYLHNLKELTVNHSDREPTKIVADILGIQVRSR